MERVDHFSSEQTLNLPYQEGYFDLVIVLATVEHLPFEGRYKYVDQYYKVLKIGGLIGFWDTPNRNFFWERHSLGLPFIASMAPQKAFIYAKFFRKLNANVTFPDFIRAGTGWRNSSYYELFPQSKNYIIKDVSYKYGYKKNNIILRFLCWIFKAPQGFFVKNLDVVFLKESSFE